MEFKSIPDILRFSISKEEAAVQFYQDMLSQAARPGTKSLFELLIRKEQEHVEALQFEMNKLGYTVATDKEELDSPLRWDDRLEIDDEARNMSFVEALLLAVQKERAAFRLYTQLLGAVKDKELAKVFMELAEEEMRHVLQLEREYEMITHHKG